MGCDPTFSWIGWSSANPRSFRRAVLDAFAVCAFGKSFKGRPLSSKLTVPVGQTKLTTPVLKFSHGVPPLFSTSTRRTYGDPYCTVCAAVLRIGLLLASKVTKLTSTLLACLMRVTE